MCPGQSPRKETSLRCGHHRSIWTIPGLRGPAESEATFWKGSLCGDRRAVNLTSLQTPRPPPSPVECITFRSLSHMLYLTLRNTCSRWSVTKRPINRAESGKPCSEGGVLKPVTSNLWSDGNIVNTRATWNTSNLSYVIHTKQIRPFHITIFGMRDLHLSYALLFPSSK